MARRQSLGDLISAEGAKGGAEDTDVLAEPVPAGDSRSPVAAEEPMPQPVQLTVDRGQVPQPAPGPGVASTDGQRRVGRPPSSPGGILTRKQATLRLAQFDQLAHLRRRLNADRTINDGPAYTDSTLIRVSVDVLLACRDQIAGKSEEEITRNLLAGLGLPHD